MIDTKELPDIIIRNEEDAYSILQKAANNEIGPYNSLIFDGWPTLNLYLKGKKFDQSITPTVMRGLLQLQKGIYQSYASAKFQSPSRKLSEHEKDDLEIKVSVKGGSSSFDINFQEIAIKLIEQLGSKMDPNAVLIAVVTIAVTYFGTSAYKSYLENRKEIRAKEVTDETQRSVIEALRFTSEQETKRTQIMAEVSLKNPQIENIVKLGYDTHTEIIKSLVRSKEARVADIQLSPEISETLTQNARRQSREVRLDGKYHLLKLDWSGSTKFKVRVFNKETGLQIDAVVQDESLTGQYKDALKNAEWSRKAVNLQINAKLFGDNEYRDAIIISATLDNSSEDAESTQA